MSGELKQNTRIPTMLGGEVRVLSRIGGGGQGDVYEVLYNGERKALKWYRHGLFCDKRSFVRNLKHNVLNGSPHESFLWPLDITDYYDGTFGYVMDLCPESYYGIDDIMLNHVTFPSFKRVVDACMGIVSAFRMLHGAGYSYQDVNTGNFFINPQTGKVLICDNDNVAPNRTSTGIVGTLGFMAPEVVLGANPSYQSDLHSLAVLVFLLFFKVNPLEGVSVQGSVLDDEEKRRVYASEALFVFERYNTDNRLDPVQHAAAIQLWDLLPDHIRNMFNRAFSQESLKDPRKRPSDVEWLRELARFRSEIMTCSCGNEVFIDNGSAAHCEVCGASVDPQFFIDISSGGGSLPMREAGGFLDNMCLIPAAPDTRLYEMQLHACGASRAISTVAWVCRSKAEADIYGIKNLSDQPWVAEDESGRRYTVSPGAVDVLRNGLVLSMYGTRVKIVSPAV